MANRFNLGNYYIGMGQNRMNPQQYNPYGAMNLQNNLMPQNLLPTELLYEEDSLSEEQGIPPQQRHQSPLELLQSIGGMNLGGMPVTGVAGGLLGALLGNYLDRKNRK